MSIFANPGNFDQKVETTINLYGIIKTTISRDKVCLTAQNRAFARFVSCSPLCFFCMIIAKGGSEMDQQKMGAFLKKLRNEKNLTQEQLAEKFNTSRRSVSRWEGGYNLPDIDILLEMSEFYEVDLKEILKGERKNEQMENREKETAVAVTDYNIERNMQDAKIAIGFFIAGFVGAIISIILRYVDLGRTFWAGLIQGLSDGIGPAAMLVGLIYAYSNIKKLRSEKERLMSR